MVGGFSSIPAVDVLYLTRRIALAALHVAPTLREQLLPTLRSILLEEPVRRGLPVSRRSSNDSNRSLLHDSLMVTTLVFFSVTLSKIVSLMTTALRSYTIYVWVSPTYSIRTSNTHCFSSEAPVTVLS